MQKTRAYAALCELRARTLRADMERTPKLGEGSMYRTISAVERPARLTFGKQLDRLLRHRLYRPATLSSLRQTTAYQWRGVAPPISQILYKQLRARSTRRFLR